MRLTDHLHEDLLLPHVASRDKIPLFREMVDHLLARGDLPHADTAVRLLTNREKVMSTAIKGGFAIPHAYMDQLDRSILMVGVSRSGIDFQAPEDELVHVVFLLLAPPRAKEEHMRLLARISRIMSRGNLLEPLQAAATAADILQILRAEDQVDDTPATLTTA